jgi:hypothetical protein
METCKFRGVERIWRCFQARWICENVKLLKMIFSSIKKYFVYKLKKLFCQVEKKLW